MDNIKTTHADEASSVFRTSHTTRKSFLSGISPVVKIAVFAALLMTGFELVKRLLLPSLSDWQSHALTIVAATAIAATAAFIYLKEREAMTRRLHREIDKRRKTEAELVEAGHTLEQKVEKRTEQLKKRNLLLRDMVKKQKIAEETLRENAIFLENVFNAIQDGIGILDTDMRIISRNKALMEMYGQDSIMAGRKCWTVYHGREERCTSCPAVRSLNDGKLHMEETPYTLNGKQIGTMELFTYPFFDSNGHVKGVVEYVRDITRQKQLEGELTAALERSEAAREAKSVFLANMSHEIRTPLNAVLGYIQLMLRDEQTGIQKQRLNVMHESALALLGLINDVLDYSKIEAGKVELRTEIFSPEELITNLIDEQKIPAREKNLELTLDIHTDLPSAVLGDSLRLSRLLRNLINNAVKYTDQGKIQVEMWSGQFQHPKITSSSPLEHFLFVISDTGRGIADKDQARIFDSFTQADSSLSKEHAGTGLGLAICKSIVRQLGGALCFDSEEGIGSAFYLSIVLPVAGCPVSQRPEVKKDTMPSIPPLKILLVEDNTVNQMFTEDLLAHLGHEVSIASDGKQGLAELEKDRFDLVLMDMQMPVMNGVEATRAVRAHNGGKFNPNIPIIGLSAFAMDQEREQFTAEGLDGYICKPVNVKNFLRTVAEVMQARPGTEHTN